MIGSREKRVGGRVSGPRAHARSYMWLCVAFAVNWIGVEGAMAPRSKRRFPPVPNSGESV
jgi:hypothetical protein